MESENSRLKVRLKGNLCICKWFIDVLYIFDRVFKKNSEMHPNSEADNFSVNFCHLLSSLWEQIHDPVSATWIAFNGKLMSFRIEIFKKQFVSVLFSVRWHINLRFIFLLTRITSAKMPANFIQFLLSSSATSEFYLKIFVTSYFR